ncbi:MAG: tetratricopeptide repeat protein [Saprospiraceae bacterium]
MAKKTTPQPKKPAQKTSKQAPAGFFDSPERWLPWALAALAFVLFGIGFGNHMLGVDDHTATVDNPAVRDFQIFNGFNLGMYAPLTWIGYEISYILGKESPIWYHVLSALVHAINVMLVFRLFRRLGSSLTVSALVALFFAIHPLQVESVAWIAGFSTPLFSMFYLLSCLWYLDYAEQGDGRSYKYALGAFVLACLSKSAAVTLPLLLVLMDWWLKRPLSDRQRLLRYVPFFLVALLFGLLTIYSRHASAMNMSDETHLSLLERALVLCYTPVFYWAKLLLPLKLNIYYSFDSIKTDFVWAYWVAPVVLAGAFWGAWKLRSQARFVLFGLLFFFVQISVMLPFQPMGTFELCADHYNYLACAGIFFILVCGFQELVKKWPPHADTLRWVGGLWAAALLVLSILQIRVWKDTATLVDKAIRNGFHQNGRLYEARGTAYANENRDLQSAIKDYSEALRINPSLTDSYKYRGNIYGVLKNYPQSVEDLSKFLEKHPDEVPELYNRGLSYANLDRTREAIADFNRVIELDPTFSRAYRARGNCLKKIGENAQGDADLQKWETMPK